MPKLETSESPCRPYHPIWYYITTTASTPLIPCNLANTIANLKVIETIKKVKTKELCSEICKKDQDFGMGCEYFNFKNNKKQKKRICYLLKVEAKKKNGFSSGAAGCNFYPEK